MMWRALAARPWRETIAVTGAGFSYGVIVGSAFHMFFALIEVSVSLQAHDSWLKAGEWLSLCNFVPEGGVTLYLQCGHSGPYAALVEERRKRRRMMRRRLMCASTLCANH